MNKIVLLSIILAVFTASFVVALPTGPTSEIVPIKQERLQPWVGKTIDALAGNVTEFNTDTSTITQTWQGYFGNITGTIVLGDANNNTLYDWALANPQGEIYAVRSSGVPAWSSVVCADAAELATEDLNVSVDAVNDEDAVNRTFLYDFVHPTFWVGSVEVAADDCAGVGLYDETGVSSTNFREVLLSDGTADLIYMAWVAHTFNPLAESTGFDDRTHDFQMIVAEDGHGTDTAPTPYYFYLELE